MSKELTDTRQLLAPREIVRGRMRTAHQWLPIREDGKRGLAVEHTAEAYQTNVLHPQSVNLTP